VSSLFELHAHPDLESPVLVVMLDGWIDAGIGAASALTALLDQAETETLATFDTDTLLDHRARRPTMHLVDGVNTSLSWPAIELRSMTDTAGHESLLLVGAEPDHSWRAFSQAVVDLAMEFGVRLVVGLGAYPAPTPHTRPTKVVTTATSVDLANQIGFVPGRIDVPAGVQAAIERQCGDLGLPATGLWAQVPHYAAAMPYPAAGAALLDSLATLTGLTFDSVALHDEAAAARRRLDELVANSDEHTAMVRQLEEHVDALEAEAAAGIGDAAMTLLSGDELAAEVERFLRDQDG
jgi:proteasome assembly chaperone (PAC2) family protein